MKRLQEIFKKAMETREHLDKLEGAGQPVKIMVGDEFIKYYWGSFKVAQKWVDFARKKWSEAVKAAARAAAFTLLELRSNYFSPP